MMLQKVLTNSKLRVPVGWVLFLASTIGMIISLFGKAATWSWVSDEPILVLTLSWLALVLEGWNAMQIAEEAKANED